MWRGLYRHLGREPAASPGAGAGRLAPPTRMGDDRLTRMAETSYPRDRILITLLENPHPAAADALTARGFSVELIPRALDGDELREVIAASHVIGVRSRTKIREEHLAAATRLLAIG